MWVMQVAEAILAPKGHHATRAATCVSHECRDCGGLAKTGKEFDSNPRAGKRVRGPFLWNHLHSSSQNQRRAHDFDVFGILCCLVGSGKLIGYNEAIGCLQGTTGFRN